MERIEMEKNENRRFRFQSCSAATAVAVTLSVLATAGLAYAGKPKDKKQEATRVYRHTYDDVFQALQEAIERQGDFIDHVDKDKGTITANCGKMMCTPTYEVQVVSVSVAPETRVTIRVTTKGHLCGNIWEGVANGLLGRLQIVLATYR
ncbi:MAG: hypothetical protein ABSH05_15715 [Bryobacteraceae bacterium]|jgi:hypothetical protein